VYLDRQLLTFTGISTIVYSLTFKKTVIFSAVVPTAVPQAKQYNSCPAAQKKLAAGTEKRGRQASGLSISCYSSETSF
jgi:hypothetical protein